MNRNRISSFGAAAWSVTRAGIAAVLCVLMVDQPLLAEGVVKKTPVSKAAAQIQGQERIEHALNRLTFGPRPGDLAAVQAMGLEKWFELQLNPAAIDDSKLDARLAEYPAMQLSVGELEKKYPGPKEIKAIADGRRAMPSDPAERAMVADEVAFYKLQRAKQAEKAPAADGSATAPAGGEMMAAGGDSVAAVQPGAMVPAKKGKNKVQAGFDALQGDAAGMAAADKPIPASEIAPEAMATAGGGGQYPREEIARMMSLPVDQRMQAIMAMAPQDLVRFRQSLNGPRLQQMTDGMTPEQKEMLVALPGAVRMVALESSESRLMRDVYSERQLEAVMTDFWLNHFNVYMRKNQNEPYLIPTYERETIRAHALGSFEDLLVATAQSPAMLVYLDNFRSVGPDSMQAARLKRAQEMNPNGPLLKQASAGLNENYGRELMELHTLGVNGGYTQADVTNVAKVFTGWGLAAGRPGQGGAYGAGTFQFEERRHEPGSKVVLGKTIPEGGEQEGLEVLHMLATSPSTAHFISTKLAVRFVSDDPPAALVDRMADSFLKSNGDIKTVLRTMFHSPEFWSPAVYRAKVKTPEEFMISAVRASGAQVVNPQALVVALDKLGMPFYGMQTPNGYSWEKDGWVSTGALVNRMNFSLVLTSGRIPGVRTEWTQLLGEGSAGMMPAAYTPGAASDPALAKEKKLEQVLLGEAVSDRTRQTVLAQSTDTTATEQAATQFDLRPTGGKGGTYLPKGAARGMNAGGGPMVQDDQQAAVMAGLLLGSPEFQRR